MFNLIAQYIGYGTETVGAEVVGAEVVKSNESVDCSFGDADGEWTLVDMKNQDRMKVVEEEFHRVRSPSPLESLHSSVMEDVDDISVPVQSTVMPVTNSRRFKCAKSNKRQRAHNQNLNQHRPNQMKRNNQVFCNRGNKVYQKMRQIVHQPRKF